MHNGPRIAYVANIRMPTEKAHGYQIMKMCEALADEGARVVLFCPVRRQTNGGLRNVADPFGYYGVRRVFSVERLSNIDVFAVEPYVPRIVFTALFHAHSLVWGAWALMRIRKRADMVYLHDDPLLGALAAFFRFPLAYEVHRIPARRLALAFLAWPSVRLIGALTDHMRGRLVRELKCDPITTVALPDAADLSLFADKRPRSYFREKTGLPAGCLIVGYVGTFSALGYEKGIGSLIRAMACVREKYPDAILACAGGPDAIIPHYRVEAERAGIPSAVRFAGHMNPVDAVSWMRACDVLVIPLPRNEFFAYHTSPLKLFEYMASRIPIVASDLPSLREIVSEKTATFFEPGNTLSLAEAICGTFADPRGAASRADAAYADVLQHTWQARAKVVMEIVTR